MSRVGVRLGKRSKYGATRTTCDGMSFHSKKEAKRYSELKLLERAGEIRNLELQPEFELWAVCSECERGVAVGAYRADFRYEERSMRGREVSVWETVVEDVKSAGTKTAVYRLKKKLVEANYGIEIRET